MKRIVSVMMVLTILLTMATPAFAIKTTNRNPQEHIENKDSISMDSSPSGWTAWVETGRYNSNQKLESLTDFAIKKAITSGITKKINIPITLYQLIRILKAENLYFTTITYDRYDMWGHRQYYQERLIYSDSARTNLIDTVETEITEEWHMMNNPDEVEI